MVTPTNMYVRRQVWMSDNATRSLYRLDIKTGKWENLGEAKTAGGKGISGYGRDRQEQQRLHDGVSAAPISAVATPRPVSSTSGRTPGQRTRRGAAARR